jgi:hypothetical protein
VLLFGTPLFTISTLLSKDEVFTKNILFQSDAGRFYETPHDTLFVS